MHEFVVNNQTYKAIKLLGRGITGESWLVTDKGKQFVLKKMPASFSNEDVAQTIQQHLSSYILLQQLEIPTPEIIATDIANRSILKTYINGKTAFSYVICDEIKDSHIEQLHYMYDKAQKSKVTLDYSSTNFVIVDDVLYYIDIDCHPTDSTKTCPFEKIIEFFWSKTPSFTTFFYGMMRVYGD